MRLVGLATPYMFNAKEMDDNTGLYYYGARYYDPVVSSWLSVDPLAEKYPGHSPFKYVVNNPIRLIDPTGMGAEDIIVGGVTWTPGATGEGEYDFVQQTFAAHNQLVSDPSAGVVSTPKRTGHVILDFVGEDAIGDVKIEKGSLYGFPHITSEDGTQINFSENVGIFLQGANTEYGESGIMSAAALLGHEFGHACLAHGSPLLNARFEKVDSSPYNQNPAISQEHGWLDPLVQSFSRANGEVVPKTLRTAAPDESNSVNFFGIKSDYFLKTQGSTSTKRIN
ncbi:MAG: RHS repeat-associated core domain-containing protein [Saprospiraceae bacterium]|nr:RHS repeat-associated core domain-containing protein [Saprospiraceae bacterium]